jgi:hypothetical protein
MCACNDKQSKKALLCFCHTCENVAPSGQFGLFAKPSSTHSAKVRDDFLPLFLEIPKAQKWSKNFETKFFIIYNKK